MGSLLHRVDFISEEGTMAKEKEVSHVVGVLQENGYPTACLESWRKRKSSAAGNVGGKDRPQVFVCLPYVGGLSEEIRRILKPLSVGVVFKPQSWKWTVMKGVKNGRIRQEKAGVVYEMACKTCEALYIGETARCVCIRGKEHHAHARNRHTELSAVGNMHGWVMS